MWTQKKHGFMELTVSYLRWACLPEPKRHKAHTKDVQAQEEDKVK
jgi:hypothetical protein